MQLLLQLIYFRCTKQNHPFSFRQLFQSQILFKFVTLKRFDSIRFDSIRLADARLIEKKYKRSSDKKNDVSINLFRDSKGYYDCINVMEI